MAGSGVVRWGPVGSRCGPVGSRWGLVGYLVIPQIIVVYGQLVAGLNSSQGQLVTWLGFSASLVYLVYLVRLHKDFIFSSLLK